jgi:hypothetical protein
MDLLTLETTYLPHLRGQFSNGSAVLFLGAGFSHGTKNRMGKDVPSVKGLTQDLWALSFPSDPFDTTTQLQDIFDTALSRHRRELDKYLRDSFTVDPDSCGQWYDDILGMPWLRIYTLNIDDLVLKVINRGEEHRPCTAVSALTATDPLFDHSRLAIVHLNGMAEDGPEKLTFSRSQFAQRRGTDPAYAQLANDLLFRSIVFIGTSLDESPLWEHLEMRGGGPERHQRELRPRSYLVTPYLNRSREALLSRFNVVWLPMTAQQFTTDVIAKLGDSRSLGHSTIRQSYVSGASTKERFDKVAQLASTDKATEEYLLGAEPTWADVTSHKVAERDCFDEIWQILNAFRASPTRKQILVLTGTAGTGKSSALMVTAMRLEAEGVHVAWLDSDHIFSRQNFKTALAKEANLGAIFINDADLYETRLSFFLRDVLEHDARTLIVCETRSSKVDRIINRNELDATEIVEYTVPSLGNNDIDAILDVLDREHRLGWLKGRSRLERRAVFEGLAGRQLLVAMHMATSGRDFEAKAIEELNELKGLDQFIYGLICVASAHRFALRKEDVGIACTDESTSWLQSLDTLTRRKLILAHQGNSFRGRHRVIAQLVYDSLVEAGKLYPIIYALVRIGASNTTRYSRRDSMHVRLLHAFINHNQMKRGIEIEQARRIYSDFENALAWDAHFWLHRGAIELETDHLDRAENFLNQARSIDPDNVFIDNELAYLSFKKAIARPTDAGSAVLVDAAILTLNDVAARRPDQIAHAYHIMGQQGLIWAEVGVKEPEQKRQFLQRLLAKVEIAQRIEPGEMMDVLHNQIKRALLSLAVRPERE